MVRLLTSFLYAHAWVYMWCHRHELLAVGPDTVMIQFSARSAYFLLIARGRALIGEGMIMFFFSLKHAGV